MNGKFFLLNIIKIMPPIDLNVIYSKVVKLKSELLVTKTVFKLI